MEPNPSILSHVSLGVTDLARSAGFYEAVLATVGARRVMAHEAMVGFGRAFPEFWIGRPLGGAAASPGPGTHVAFLAASRGEVDAFWEAALAHGAAPDGAPGLRPEYHAGYYACFVRDPDGHKIEAQHNDWSASEGAGPAAEAEPSEEIEAHPS